MTRAARLPASLPRVRVPAELARRIEAELAREQAARPAESFQRADMVRTLLIEALDARAGAAPRTSAPAGGDGAEDGEALALEVIQRDGREALERALWGIMPAWGAKAREDADRRGVPLHLQAAYMRAHKEAAERVLESTRRAGAKGGA